MSEMNQIGIPGVGNGILMPQTQCKWRLAVTERVPIIEEIKQLLLFQIVSFKFNYHLQLLEMEIEQNANNSHLHTLVKQLSKLSKINKYDDINFVVEELNGSDDVNGRYMFESCKLLDHRYNLDYASSETCKHWLKFSFKKTQDLT